MLDNFSRILSSDDFFKIIFFEKILPAIPSECQTVWTQIRFNILLRLSEDETSKQRVKEGMVFGKVNFIVMILDKMIIMGFVTRKPVFRFFCQSELQTSLLSYRD